GVARIRTAEAVSLGDGAADPAHLPSEAEIVFARPRSIFVQHSDRRQLQHERQRQEPEKRSRDCGPGGSHHRAIVYQDMSVVPTQWERLDLKGRAVSRAVSRAKSSRL